MMGDRSVVVGNEAERTSSVLKKLLFFSLLIIIVPIFLYFASKKYIFEVMFSMTGTNSYFYSAIVAIAAIHIILAMFIYVAWTEGQTTYKAPFKAE